MSVQLGKACSWNCGNVVSPRRNRRVWTDHFAGPDDAEIHHQHRCIVSNPVVAYDEAGVSAVEESRSIWKSSAVAVIDRRWRAAAAVVGSAAGGGATTTKRRTHTHAWKVTVSDVSWKSIRRRTNCAWSRHSFEPRCRNCLHRIERMTVRAAACIERMRAVLTATHLESGICV
jgi:hypothetical protein